MMNVLLGVVIFFGVLIIYTVIVYNGLVAKRNRVHNAWSQIDVQLKRRYDLIPNLVEAVRGYLQHEKSLFENLSEARTKAMHAGSDIALRSSTENALTRSLGALFAVAESYPELKSNQNMLVLQEELASTENKAAFARQFYNDSVMEYNTACQTFPANLLADLFLFNTATSFVMEDSRERSLPPVRF